MEQPKKLMWIDCDPGHDDMIALIIAIQDKSVDLVGITVSAGNGGLENTEKNALRILKFFGLDKKVPVLVGSNVKYNGEQFFCDNFHGLTGLDGVDLEYSEVQGIRESVNERMLEIFKKRCEGSQNKIHFVVTGPLTNACILLNQKSEIKQYIEQISIMGGGNQLSNVTESAEFNFYSDPLAADLVLNSGVKIFLAILDLTHSVLFNQQHLEQIGKLKDQNKLAKLVFDSMTFYTAKYNQFRGKPEGPMHDPLAVYYVINPEAFQIKFVNVVVEYQSKQNYGRSVIDLYNRTTRKPNVNLGISTNSEDFFNYLIKLIQTYSDSN